MAGKGGGAWKVAYADFVTAMMAFFMVMWLLSQDAKVKDAVALHFRNPYGQYAMGDSLMAPKKEQYFKDRPHSHHGHSAPPVDNEGPKTRRPYTLTLHRGDRTIVGTVVTFDQNEIELSQAGREMLQGLIPQLEGKPQKIEIRGHALRRPLPGAESMDPWQLSYRRCMNAMEFLIEKGIPPERIRLSQAGAYEPYTLDDEPTQAANNSRIEVYLLNEVAQDASGTAEERDRRFKDEPQPVEPHSTPAQTPTDSHATHASTPTAAKAVSHAAKPKAAKSKAAAPTKAKAPAKPAAHH